MTARLVTRMLSAVIVVAVLAFAPALADAWGAKGHRLVGLVAKELLDPEARAAIKDIMGSDDLATFALFLDINKATLAQQIPGSRDWHYDDVPICKTQTKADFCKNGACASTQIVKHEADLGDVHADQKFAVRVLTHLVGDIHQPLHGADNDDRGGNGVKVSFPAVSGSGTKRTKLHSAWDGDMVERKFRDQNEVTAAKKLVTKFKAQAASEKWAEGTPDDWIAESHKIAKETVYGKLPGFACGTALTKTIKLPPEYLKDGQDIAEVQIAKGGFRLAAILNRVLGGD